MRKEIEKQSMKESGRQSFSKMAASEMWWIIIGAVIALIVLIVLLVLFTGKTKGLEGGLSSCGVGGICVSGEVCPSGTSRSETFTCSKTAETEKQCCIGIPKRCSDSPDSADCVKNKEECVPVDEESYCFSK